MQTRSSARRLFVTAAVSVAVLGAAALGAPAAGANPGALGPLPVIVAASGLSSISVSPGGTDAWVEFISSEPTAARISVKATNAVQAAPVALLTVSTPATEQVGVGVGLLPSTVPDAATVDTIPSFDTSHRLHLAHLKPGTAYDATIFADTRSGTQLSGQVHFETLPERVRITVDSIDIQHGGALFGDNSVWWNLGVDWGNGNGFTGSVSTCFPSNDAGDPAERIVGVCHTGSYGDGTFTPLNNRGHRLSWVFAQENFDVMPTTFNVRGSADEQDLFSPGEPNPEYKGRGCTPGGSIVMQYVAQTVLIAVCGDDLNTTFQSLVTYRIELFYDNATYPSPKRNAPTSPWI